MHRNTALTDRKNERERQVEQSKKRLTGGDNAQKGMDDTVQSQGGRLNSAIE